MSLCVWEVPGRIAWSYQITIAGPTRVEKNGVSESPKPGRLSKRRLVPAAKDMRSESPLYHEAHEGAPAHDRGQNIDSRNDNLVIDGDRSDPIEWCEKIEPGFDDKNAKGEKCHCP